MVRSWRLLRVWKVSATILKRSMATASGYVSVLVIALYINGDVVGALYRHPDLLWFNFVLLLFWISRSGVGDAVRPERARKLYPERVRPRPQRLDRPQELPQVPVHAAEPPLVPFRACLSLTD